MKPKTIISVLLFLILVKIEGQTILSEDFSGGLPKEIWNLGDNIELGHLNGVVQSDFLRFHPRFKQETIITEELDMQDGFYRLYYTWMENGIGNPDSVVVFLSTNNQNWSRLGSFGGGTQRNWLLDSIDIGSPENSNSKLKFVYNGKGRFPATYINIDDIHIDKVAPPTAIRNNTLEVDIQAYPNPANDIIHLKVANTNFKEITYQLLTLDGKVLAQQDIPGTIIEWQGNLILEGYSVGTYFVRFASGNEEKTIQFIIAK